MSFSAPMDKFEFPDSGAYRGKRVLVTGSGRDGGIGQALTLAAALNGAEVVGVHFHRSYQIGRAHV